MQEDFLRLPRQSEQHCWKRKDDEAKEIPVLVFI